MYIARHLPRTSSLICGMIFAGSILSATGSKAATYYVATDGNSTNPGSEAQPFRTIRQGISVLKAGDTLYIKSGTYNEPIDSNTMTVPAGTSWDDTVTIAANPGDTVTLQPTDQGEVLNLANPSIRYLVIQGLKLDGINLANTSSTVGNGISLYGVSYVRVIDCEVFNAPGNGIFTSPGSGAADYNQFIHLNVHDNGYTNNLFQGVGHGIYMTTDSNLIEDSEIHDNYGYGVHIFTHARRPSMNTVSNNDVYNNGRGPYAAAVTPVGILLSSGDGNAAYNNTVWGNLSNGIEIGYDASESKVYNNTVHDNGGYGIIVTNATNTDIRDNILYSNVGTIYDAGTATVLSNNQY
jgi:parallel beta-helix repeat protein